MRSKSCADSKASICASGMGSTPRLFKARQANRIVSRLYRVASSRGARPFCPRLAPGSISDRNLWSSAACGRFRTMKGHISSMRGPTARPLSCHIHAGLAVGDFGEVGPKTPPPANSLQRHANSGVVVPMEMVACQVTFPFGELRWIMNDPSPSSNPARYAASSLNMCASYQGAVAKPSYWRTAVQNLRDLDAEMDVPTLLDVTA